MKIIQINSVVNDFSTGRISRNLSYAMDDNGIENKIIFGVGEPYDANNIKIGSTAALKLNILRTRLFGKHSFYSEHETRRIIDLLRDEKPDIVHLHQMHGHYINIKLLFEYLAVNDIPTVWTIHDCWPLTGHCAHFDECGCMKWKTGCGGCEQLHRYPISWFFDRSEEAWRDKKRLYNMHKNLHIVTPSDWLLGLVRQSILKDKPAVRIYNGIDHNIFKPDIPGFRAKHGLGDEYVILSVYKNDIRSIDLYNNIAARLGGNERLAVIGLPLELIDRLDKRIIAEPYLNKYDLAKAYSGADVFLNTTTEESFGLVIAEVLFCGTPAVVCDRTAIPEVVGSSECGEILHEFSVENIMNAIYKIKNSGMDYKTTCVNRADALFEKNKNNNKYIDLYKTILEE